MKKTLFRRFICLLAVMLLAVSMIPTATAIEDGTDTYTEENCLYICDNENVVQPRKPVYPYFCSDCHSSSYYVTGSTRINIDWNNRVYCAHNGRENGDCSATDSVLLRCNDCNRGEQWAVYKWGVYCIEESTYYWTRAISY